jgi:hypothetical protein
MMTTSHNRVAARAQRTRAAPFPIPPAVDEELEWFFSVQKSEVEDETMGDEDEGYTAAAIAYRKIRVRLLEMEDRDAGVLKSAYRPGPWPAELHESLGRLTGVVVRLASAEIGWPEDSAEQDKLEARVGGYLERARIQSGVAALARFRPRATEFLKSAIQSYARERGRGPSLVPRMA